VPFISLRVALSAETDNRKFPGAMESPMTTQMDFTTPSQVACIPTFHVMDRKGALADETREPPQVSDNQALTWYKNMLTGTLHKEGAILHENLTRIR